MESADAVADALADARAEWLIHRDPAALRLAVFDVLRSLDEEGAP